MKNQDYKSAYDCLNEKFLRLDREAEFLRGQVEAFKFCINAEQALKER